MYFIVGKTINQNKQIISYLITDGNSVRGVTPLQVYVEYQKGNLPYLKGFNTNTGEVDFKNIDNSLIPTFYNGSGINNNVSVLKILEENNKQVGVRILVASGKIMKVSLSDILKLVNSKKIQLFNAKIVNNKVVMKYVGATVTETNRGNKEEVTINNYDKSKFVIDDNLRLIKYIGNDKEVIIPKGVTSIGKDVFYNRRDFTSIVIPNSITSIGVGVFSGCTSLISITIPDSVTSIGDSAFSKCTGLTSINIPNSVTSIGDSAFSGCIGLKSITISDSITSIGGYAFRGCTSLISITIPDSVISIGWGAFSDCIGLTRITIPNSVTSIEDSVFEGCTGLTSIKIPNSVTSIGWGAFICCTGLTSITIPNSVTSIRGYVFAGCTELKSITIPDSVTSIGDYAFAHCTRLRSITIPDSITNIGEDAFLNCTSLTSIIIPDSVERVGKHAFRYWTSSQTIYIKDVSFAVRERSKDWNQECEAKIVLDDVESDNMIVAFGNCGKDGDKVIWRLDDKGLLVISGDGKMGDFSITSDIPWWHEKRESIKTVIIKEGVTSIGSSVFTCHTNLRSITIPDSVTSIGACAFYYCGNLTSINISDSVTSIGNWAFEGCLNICIIGGHGSTAEKYAMDNNIKFRAI